jgi:hypothetical protein
MSTCMARKGFLTLSDCGEPAVTACSNCGRPMCTVHLAPQSGFSQCLDCAATAPQSTEEQQKGEGEYDDVWAHRYRTDYYSSSGYRPFYSGTRTTDPYYDRQDVRAFDDDVNDDGPDEDDAETGGFGDS